MKGRTIRSNRADQLQFFRYVAFLWIFLLHADRWNFLRLPAANGAAEAVGFFIMLSGYATGYSGYGKERKASLAGILTYVRTKALKVYPLYLFVMLYAVCRSPIPQAIANHNWAWLRDLAPEFLTHLFLLQSWVDHGYFAYAGLGWFLSTLLFLYVFNLPLLGCMRRLEKRRGACAGFAAGIALCFALLTAYSYAIRTQNTEFWGYIFPPSRVFEYFGGMLLGYMTRMMKWNEKTGRVVCFTLLEAAALLLWLGVTLVPAAAWTYRCVQWFLPNMLLLAVFGAGRGAITAVFRQPLLRMLGDVTFECYLLHHMVLTVYIQFCGVQGAMSRLGSLFSLAFCLMMTTHLACLIHGMGRARQNAAKV